MVLAMPTVGYVANHALENVSQSVLSGSRASLPSLLDGSTGFNRGSLLTDLFTHQAVAPNYQTLLPYNNKIATTGTKTQLTGCDIFLRSSDKTQSTYVGLLQNPEEHDCNKAPTWGASAIATMVEQFLAQPENQSFRNFTSIWAGPEPVYIRQSN